MSGVGVWFAKLLLGRSLGPVSYVVRTNLNASDPEKLTVDSEVCSCESMSVGSGSVTDADDEAVCSW